MSRDARPWWLSPLLLSCCPPLLLSSPPFAKSWTHDSSRLADPTSRDMTEYKLVVVGGESAASRLVSSFLTSLPDCLQPVVWAKVP